ncbi:MAG: CoA transferase [Dehalococcoidia bacterium]
MLDDLKLIELGHGISAAFCTKLFADLGADVIKIEPLEGDSLRSQPPFAGDEPGIERSGLFAYANTSKLGVTMDVTTARGRELFLELIRSANILVENNAPLWLTNVGLDYERLAAVNPALIMTSITPFGQDGPWRDYLGNEFIAQHTSGVAYHNGARAQDLDAEPPLPLPGSMGDFAGGLAAAAATMCALFARDATGRGDHVDVALQEVLAMHEQVDLSHVTHTGNVPSRSASANPPIAYIGQQPTADGYIDLIVRTEEHWRNLLAVFGNPEWAENELFVDLPSRSRYWDALEPFVQEETRKFDKEDLFRESQAHGVSAAPVNSIGDAAEEAHFQDRGSFAQFAHPVIGTVRCPGPPIGFAIDAWRIRRPAPLLGQHNDEVYGQRLGYSHDELAALREARVI